MMHNITPLHYGRLTAIWKPHGLPTTFGGQYCLLDHIADQCHHDTMLMQRRTQQTTAFDRATEYGLLNRLDNDTAGLVRFACDHDAKHQYLAAQSLGQIKKIYLADVYGHMAVYDHSIQSPIMHSRRHDERMILVERDGVGAGRWQVHTPTTLIQPLYYDPLCDRTTILVTITKWVRHQIRVHLSGMGHSIVGESLYEKTPSQGEVLHLRSIGLYRGDVA